jgi:uncharacterized protein (DUF2141 family)
MARVGLKEAIQAAYEQLHAAVTEIPLRGGLDFQYESIELELNVEVDESREHQGDVKFWVVSAGAKRSRTRRSTHMVKVAITPLWSGEQTALPDGEGAVRIRSGADVEGRVNTSVRGAGDVEGRGDRARITSRGDRARITSRGD